MAMKSTSRSSNRIGRNQPCFCGSGKKYKRCHGDVTATNAAAIGVSPLSSSYLREIETRIARHKAKEHERAKQQGLGRPIISIEHAGYRFVAVGNKLHYGRWKTFGDFLSQYIKFVLGSDWGNAEIAKPLRDRHPLFLWYDKLCRMQQENAKGPGEIFSTPVTGAISAYHRLCYNLYLIAHNVKDVQTLLIRRLKNKESFQGAYFETQVAAWMINAGFDLEFEDETDRTSSHCEFSATYRETGEKFSVEAKSREINHDTSTRPKVGRKLVDALEKTAKHKRLVFINLNRPIYSLEAADREINRAERILRNIERDKTNHPSLPPAYVIISNLSEQYALDSAAYATLVTFHGFKIRDFMGVVFPSVRDAVRARERHWAMHQLLKSIETHIRIPQTFGGELESEVFGDNPRPRLLVGDRIEAITPRGEKTIAKIVDAEVLNGNALLILKDTHSDTQWLGQIELTKEELDDYERHKSTYFGKPKGGASKVETPIEFFDFLFDVYQHTPREKLLQLMDDYPDIETLKNLSQRDLAEIFCERHVLAMIQQGALPSGSQADRALWKEIET